MHLLTTALLQHLLSYGLPKVKLEVVRKLLGWSEKLKRSEQKLNYLEKCKKDNVFPVSILNGVRANCVRDTECTRNLIKKLRKVAFNQSIGDNHNYIRVCKKELSGAKHVLYRNTSDQFLLHEIFYTAQNYCHYVKQYHKTRLQKNFRWVLEKYYRIRPEPIPMTGRSDPDKLVTISNPEGEPAHLEGNEVKLLALGPGFAVSPIINDKTIRDVELNLAQCSYKLKWMNKLDDKTYGHLVMSEFKRSQPQLQSPFIATPPNVGVEVDVMINKLSTFVINTVKTSVVKVNVNRDQLAGYKSLKARTDLQITKSDKSGDFVVSNIDA